MLLALIFCMLGDVLLGYTKNDKKVFMVPGLLSFLLAHIMYITVMNHFVGFHWFQLIFSIFGLVLLKIVTYTLDIHFGFKRYVIWLYTFIIFMTGSKALGLLYTHQNICMGIGGISFLISDFILLFLYFKYKNNKILQFSNSIIYYFAQYMFAISAYFM